LDAPSSDRISIGNLNNFQVIPSSGTGKVEHFSEVFEKTDVEAALAAGIFHREEVPIEAVKEHMRERGIETR
jgi:glutamine amidotransferase/cyclase